MQAIPVNEARQKARALEQMGLSRKSIAAKLGVSLSQVKRWLDDEAADAPPQSKMPRACLCCGRPFMSAGPMNRLCSRCRISVTDLELYGDC